MEYKSILLALASVALMVLLALSFLSFRSLCNYRATNRTDAFRTESERAKFRSLLHKHGLENDVSVIYDWNTGRPYFYRDGRRCSFT